MLPLHAVKNILKKKKERKENVLHQCEALKDYKAVKTRSPCAQNDFAKCMMGWRELPVPEALWPLHPVLPEAATLNSLLAPWPGPGSARQLDLVIKRIPSCLQ